MDDPMAQRWIFYKDANFDGAITISDVWLWIKWLYFAPGDLIIYLVSQSSGLRAFFELSEESYGNWFSAMVGVPFAAIALLFGSILIALAFRRG